MYEEKISQQLQNMPKVLVTMYQKTDAVILEKGIKNYDQRILLEALYSKLSADTVNEHALFNTY